MKLYLYLPHIPRTVGRKEWYKIWRWKRKTEKDLMRVEADQIELLRSKELPDYIHQDVMDRLINPPLLLGPYMDKSL